MGSIFSKLIHSLFDYVPPKIWKFVPQGGKFGGINRPTAGPREKKDVPPKGQHSLQLYSLATPNGQKVTCLLEELCIEYGLEYDAWVCNILDGSQFHSGFVYANPNSKIPALLHYNDYSTHATNTENTDTMKNGDPTVTSTNSNSKPTRVFESAAILFYLCEQFDSKHLFLPPMGDEKRAECLSWLFWVQGSAPFVGGGFGHFYTYAPIKIKYAIDRYTMETKRQLHVLERHLAGTEEEGNPKHKYAGGPYLCGDSYTIADMCAFPWYGNLVMGKLYPGSADFLQVQQEYPHVVQWAQRILERKGVKRGLIVNKTWGSPEEHKLPERHHSIDFEPFDELR